MLISKRRQKGDRQTQEEVIRFLRLRRKHPRKHPASPLGSLSGWYLEDRPSPQPSPGSVDTKGVWGKRTNLKWATLGARVSEASFTYQGKSQWAPFLGAGSIKEGRTF